MSAAEAQINHQEDHFYCRPVPPLYPSGPNVPLAPPMAPPMTMHAVPTVAREPRVQGGQLPTEL